MDINKNLLIKNYLSNLQVNLIIAGYTKCWDSWREIDYIPQYNKFYFICSGEGWLKVGAKEFYPKPGQLFLMPAGIIQSYSAINQNTFTKHWCHFTATIGDMNIFDIIKPPYFVNINQRQELESIFKKLVVNYKSQEITASLRIKSLLYEIIACFIENSFIEELNPNRSSSINKLNYVIEYIDKNLESNITVEDLSQIVHLHPNYFIKIFKKHLGVSPIHYMNELRLGKAKGLLEATDLTVTQIASSVGYKDLFYFSKVFKNYSGFSPSEFRNIKKASNS